MHIVGCRKESPTTQRITVEKDATPIAADLIKNRSDLPTDTTYDFKAPGVDTSAPGRKQAIIIVTYPDGTKDEVRATVYVKDDSETYAPVARPITLDSGATPSPANAIANKDDLPEDTTYTFKAPGVDIGAPGEQEVTIVVTYPDGSTEEVRTTVYVKDDAETYEPTAQPISIDIGEMPDAADGIANKDDLPEGTNYAFKAPGVDIGTSGEQEVTVIVTYPDGSIDEVKIAVTVSDQIADSLTTRIAVERNLETVKKLSWRVAEGADGYFLYRKGPGEDAFTLINNLTETNYTDIVEVAGFYLYIVYPYKDDGRGGKVIGQCENHVYTYRRLLPVQNLQARKANNGIMLTWNPVKYAEKYVIYRMGPGDEEMKAYKTIPASQTSFLDQTNTDGYYFYRVIPQHTALGNTYGAVSIHCATITLKTKLPLSPVQNLKAVNKYNLYNDLTWNKVPGAYGYLIYRQAPGEAKPTFYRGTTRNGFTEKVAVPGYYHYIVLAYRKNPDGTLTLSPQNGYATTYIAKAS